MKRILLGVLFLLLFNNFSFAEIVYKRGERLNETTVRLWYFMDTSFGQTGYAQIKYNIGAGDIFTNFVEGAFDLSTPDPNTDKVENWFIDIDLGISIPANFEIQGAIDRDGGGPAGGGDEFTAFLPITASSLPVELTSFTARLTADATQLNWITASELNNSHFDIQHSTDARTWATLAKVDGHGTTNEMQYYSYTDKNVARGTNYYRLKQVDFDGAFEYSDIVTIENDQAKTIRVFPTVVTSEITVKDATGAAHLFNATGQLIRSFNLNAATEVLDVSTIQNGWYFLQLSDGNGNVETKRLVKF